MDSFAIDDELHHLIHTPSKDASQTLLELLGIASIPNPEEIHREIEESILLPKERLPDHWLPTYQMYEFVLGLKNVC